MHTGNDSPTTTKLQWKPDISTIKEYERSESFIQVGGKYPEQNIKNIRRQFANTMIGQIDGKKLNTMIDMITTYNLSFEFHENDAARNAFNFFIYESIDLGKPLLSLILTRQNPSLLDYKPESSHITLREKLANIIFNSDFVLDNDKVRPDVLKPIAEAAACQDLEAIKRIANSNGVKLNTANSILTFITFCGILQNSENLPANVGSHFALSMMNKDFSSMECLAINHGLQFNSNPIMQFLVYESVNKGHLRLPFYMINQNQIPLNYNPSVSQETLEARMKKLVAVKDLITNKPANPTVPAEFASAVVRQDFYTLTKLATEHELRFKDSESLKYLAYLGAVTGHTGMAQHMIKVGDMPNSYIPYGTTLPPVSSLIQSVRSNTPLNRPPLSPTEGKKRVSPAYDNAAGNPMPPPPPTSHTDALKKQRTDKHHPGIG